jgi:hypothetical protein
MVTVALSYKAKHESPLKLLGHSVYYTPEYRSGLTRAGIG